MFNSAKEVMRLPRFVLLVSWFVCERDYSEKLGMHFREVLETGGKHYIGVLFVEHLETMRVS